MSLPESLRWPLSSRPQKLKSSPSLSQALFIYPLIFSPRGTKEAYLLLEAPLTKALAAGVAVRSLCLAQQASNLARMVL